MAFGEVKFREVIWLSQNAKITVFGKWQPDDLAELDLTQCIKIIFCTLFGCFFATLRRKKISQWTKYRNRQMRAIRNPRILSPRNKTRREKAKGLTVLSFGVLVPTRWFVESHNKPVSYTKLLLVACMLALWQFGPTQTENRKPYSYHKLN